MHFHSLTARTPVLEYMIISLDNYPGCFSWGGGGHVLIKSYHFPSLSSQQSYQKQVCLP